MASIERLNYQDDQFLLQIAQSCGELPLKVFHKFCRRDKPAGILSRFLSNSDCRELSVLSGGFDALLSSVRQNAPCTEIPQSMLVGDTQVPYRYLVDAKAL